MDKKIIFLISFLMMINLAFALNISSNETNSTNLVINVVKDNSSLMINQNEINPYKNKEVPEVNLHGQKFYLNKGLDNNVKLKSKLLLKDEKTYAIIQFNRYLDKENKEKLEQEGLKLLEYISKDTYYVSINKNLDNIFETNADGDLKIKNKNFNDKYLVRSIGEIKPEYKLSKNLREGKIGDWAIAKDGNVYLTVQFHGDVTLDRAEKLMNEKGFEVVSRLKSINALTIKVEGGEKK